MQNFVVYRSSAGSGKTFTLVKEYLRLSLYDPARLQSNFRKILAVTFTNKAAAEMKQRVIIALDQLVHRDEETVPGRILTQELAISYPELRRRARIVLSSILHQYSDFSISTIDSFTHKVVKTFAHDLHLPVNFNVELDTNGFYEKVVAALFSRIGDDPQISRLLTEYALGRVSENTGWDPENVIVEFSKLLQKESAAPFIEKLNALTTEELEAIRREFSAFVSHYRERLKERGAEALALIAAAGLTDEDFVYKKSGPQSFFRKCAAGEEVAVGARVQDAINTGSWGGKKPVAALAAISPQLTSIARELAEFIGQNGPFYNLSVLLGKQMYPLMLLRKIEEICSEFRDEERVVFISEFNRRIYEIVQAEPAPYIYERLGEKYRHFLIDEFQDTSTLQWKNILPLVDNSLANGWFNLIVGDGKQSIYRWRNANVSQFAALPAIDSDGSEIARQRGDTLQRNFENRLLNANYRSGRHIVEFNNRLFGHLSTQLLSEQQLEIYRAHAQEVVSRAHGYVTVTTARTGREELDAHTMSAVNRHIDEAVAAGFSFKDICVLTRFNRHGSAVAEALVAAGRPVVSAESLLLSANLEVSTLIALLRYLVNPADNISAAAVLSFLRQSDQATEEFLVQALPQLSSGRPLWELLREADIDLSPAQLSTQNLLDQCISIIKALHLDTRAHHYLRFLLDEVTEFLVTHGSGLSEFIQWWETRSTKASMVIPDSTDAVKVMSIHASKGLEFPVVIIPYCHWPVHKSDDTWVNVANDKSALPVGVVSLTSKAAAAGFSVEVEQEQQEQLLDNLNLLYVAFTRAVERLHIISTCADTSRTKSVNAWIEDYLSGEHRPASENFYAFGDPLPKAMPAETGSPGAFPLQPIAFDASEELIRIKGAASHNLVMPALEGGINMHALLARVAYRIDAVRAIDTALREGLFPPQSKQLLTEKVDAIVSHPMLHALFNDDIECMTECELVTTAGELLRPDRVVRSEERCVVIDYKTGQEDKRHHEQVRSYMQALRDLGCGAVSGLIVYTDDVSVIEVN